MRARRDWISWVSTGRRWWAALRVSVSETKWKSDGGDGGGDGEVPPAGPVVERRGQDGKGGNAVEKDRDSEPEKSHGPGCSIRGARYEGRGTRFGGERQKQKKLRLAFESATQGTEDGMPAAAHRILCARTIPLEAKFVGGANANDGCGGECGILAFRPWRKRRRATAGEQTPVMRQYFAAKQAHPDCLMFCRIGDFYELFYEDAIVASRELQLTLTARDREKKQPMCGVPYHAAEQYIQRLLRKGYRMALCEQMEDPKLTKKIVRREVTRVLTPGTAVDPALGAEQSNWLASVAASGVGGGSARGAGAAGPVDGGVSRDGVCGSDGVGAVE